MSRFSDEQADLFDILFRPGVDSEAYNLFHDLEFNDNVTDDEREDIYEELSEYLWDEYGYDFEDMFDWEAFREWYG